MNLTAYNKKSEREEKIKENKMKKNVKKSKWNLNANVNH
jgi:hypothetical protein